MSGGASVTGRAGSGLSAGVLSSVRSWGCTSPPRGVGTAACGRRVTCTEAGKLHFVRLRGLFKLEGLHHGSGACVCLSDAEESFTVQRQKSLSGDLMENPTESVSWSHI